MNLLIILRRCDNVYAVNSMPRPFNLSKYQIIKKCYSSLKRRISKCKDINYTFYVLGDSLSQKAMQIFDQKDIIINKQNMGNIISLVTQYRLAIQLQDKYDYVYFCEDDYYYDQNCFSYIKDLFDNKQKVLQGYSASEVVIHPCDYPDRYYSKFGAHGMYPSLIFLSDKCHWRQTRNTTCSYLIPKEVFLKYNQVYIKSNQNDGLLSQILYNQNNVLCLSPIPGLTSHLHQHTMTPFLDVRGSSDN